MMMMIFVTAIAKKKGQSQTCTKWKYFHLCRYFFSLLTVGKRGAYVWSLALSPSLSPSQCNVNNLMAALTNCKAVWNHTAGNPEISKRKL